MILPESWAVVLQVFAPVFARRGTFRVFTVLATGMVAATGRRTVVGMLAGAGMARQLSFHAACRFFSSAVWDADRLGLAAAGFIVDHLLDPQAPIVVAVDDTLFRRWGRRIHHVFWTHDGSAQGKAKIGRGNRWIVAGIVVRLPFCTAAVPQTSAKPGRRSSGRLSGSLPRASALGLSSIGRHRRRINPVVRRTDRLPPDPAPNTRPSRPVSWDCRGLRRRSGA